MAEVSKKPDTSTTTPVEGGKPWDSALGAVTKQLGDATKSVRDATADGVGQVRGVVSANVTQAKELTSSARVAIARSAQKGWEAVQQAVHPAVQVFEQADSAEGTPLRKHFAAAREGFNRQLYDAQVRTIYVDWGSPRPIPVVWWRIYARDGSPLGLMCVRIGV